MSRQKHPAERHGELVCESAQRRREFVGASRLVFADARNRIEGPPRESDESTGEEYPAPILPLVSKRRLSSMTCDVAHLHISLAGLPPHRACGGTYSPFIRKESAASTDPSPIVTP